MMSLRFRTSLVLTVLIAFGAFPIRAHEGHQPLPTKGVQIDTAKGYITLSGQAQSALGIQTEEVKRGKVATNLKVYSESLTPWNARGFGSAQIPGRIEKLLVRPGDLVAKDQIVALLSSRDLEVVKLDFLEASNDLALNQRLLDMTRPTAQSGAVPMQRLFEIENALEQSQNRLDIAKVRGKSLGVSFDDATQFQSTSLFHPIRAPISGRVLHSDLAEGKFVEAFEHLFEIVNTDQVWVRLQLLEKDVYKTAIGNRVKLDFPGISVEGVIDQIDVGLDRKTQVSSAWVTIGHPDLIPGLVGTATVTTSEDSEALTVPLRAVYSDGLQSYVFVEEASTKTSSEFRKKAIRPGKRRLDAENQTEQMVEVLQGELYPGDRVVVKGGHELSSLFFLGTLKLTSTERQKLGIQTATASYRELSKAIPIPATVTLPPENRSVISSQLNGTVHSHQIYPGRTIKAGDKLIEIASPEFYKLQLDLISTALEADLSRRRADRLERVKGDAVSMRVVMETRGQAERFEVRASSLKRQLMTLGLLETEVESIVKQRRALDYLPIRSNIDGQIASFEVTLGETVAANQPLVEIHNLDLVWLEAYLPSMESKELTKLPRGMATILANPEIRFPVDLTRIAPTVNEATRTQRLWFSPNSKELPRLRSGALATIVLSVGTSTTCLAVPNTAILRDGVNHFIFVQKNDGNVERRRVTIGRSDGEFTQVIQGIEAGEVVVTSGGRELQTAYASLR